MNRKKGIRCRLLGNPPKHASGKGGDQLDGKIIPVSPHILEYHAPGSFQTPTAKYPLGGVWVHVYRRANTKTDAFRYVGSECFSADKDDDAERADRDRDTLARLIGGK